jgi:hypothetical protein
LAHSGKTNVLVSADPDVLALAGKTVFAIEASVNYPGRFSSRGV